MPTILDMLMKPKAAAAALPTEVEASCAGQPRNEDAEQTSSGKTPESGGDWAAVQDAQMLRQLLCSTMHKRKFAARGHGSENVSSAYCCRHGSLCLQVPVIEWRRRP
jgi:hypothetical protein